MPGKLTGPILGAVAGAALVALLAGALGIALDEPAHPAILVACILLGAVLGAYAWGVVAYEREHEPEEPSAEYTDGVLAEQEPRPVEASPESGLAWLLRRRAGSLARLPLTPWI